MRKRTRNPIALFVFSLFSGALGLWVSKSGITRSSGHPYKQISILCEEAFCGDLNYCDLSGGLIVFQLIAASIGHRVISSFVKQSSSDGEYLLYCIGIGVISIQLLVIPALFTSHIRLVLIVIGDVDSSCWHEKVFNHLQDGCRHFPSNMESTESREIPCWRVCASGFHRVPGSDGSPHGLRCASLSFRRPCSNPPNWISCELLFVS